MSWLWSQEEHARPRARQVWDRPRFELTARPIFTCIWGIPRQIDQAETFIIFVFFYIQVCYKWPQKNYPRQFPDFFENFLAVMVGIFDLALRTVIDSFEIWNANSKKKLKLIYLRKVYRYIPSKKWDSESISNTS